MAVRRAEEENVLTRQIQLARGNADRQVLVSRWKSYHGLTMGALAAAGHHDPASMTPFPTMHELFSVGWGQPDLREQWKAADVGASFSLGDGLRTRADSTAQLALADALGVDPSSVDPSTSKPSWSRTARTSVWPPLASRHVNGGSSGSGAR